MSGVPSSKFRVVAASVQGTSHLRTATPCQDAFTFAETPTGDLIVAVADGAGSAQFSGEGAQMAVTSAVETLCTALDKYRPASRRAWQVVLESAFHAAHQAIGAAAAARQCEPRHFAATLLLLLLADQQTICGLVGDCAAVVQLTDGTLLSLCPPQRGEYANTTNFIVQPNYAAFITIRQSTEKVTAAALFSDGLAPLAMNLTKNEPFAPFFQPLLAFLASAEDATAAGEQLADFLGSERVNARTDDDKTLVLIQRNLYTAVPIQREV